MSSIREQYRMSKKRWKNMVQKVADDSLEVMKNKYMTTLEQQQKEARMRATLTLHPHLFGANHTTEDADKFLSFLDTEIAKAYQSGQESALKEVERKAVYTECVSPDDGSKDWFYHIDGYSMEKLKKSLSTEKLKVADNHEKEVYKASYALYGYSKGFGAKRLTDDEIRCAWCHKTVKQIGRYKLDQHLKDHDSHHEK